eukprot:332763-Chlamydomonas_euryale.AAC.2
MTPSDPLSWQLVGAELHVTLHSHAATQSDRCPPTAAATCVCTSRRTSRVLPSLCPSFPPPPPWLPRQPGLLLWNSHAEDAVARRGCSLINIRGARPPRVEERVQGVVPWHARPPATKECQASQSQAGSRSPLPGRSALPSNRQVSAPLCKARQRSPLPGRSALPSDRQVNAPLCKAGEHSPLPGRSALPSARQVSAPLCKAGQRSPLPGRSALPSAKQVSAPLCQAGQPSPPTGRSALPSASHDSAPLCQS